MPRIMVVDDEVVILLQLEEELKAMGYEVVGTATSGEEGVEMAGRLRPDLVLMDIVMNGRMDGIDAAEKIGLDLEIPVILITAYGQDRFIERAKNIQPFGYIVKPFQRTEIKGVIEIALHRVEMDRRLKQSEARYRTLLETIQDGVYTLDREGYIGFVNDIMADRAGKSREWFLGRNFLDLVQRKDRDRLKKAFDEMIRGIGSPVHEFSLVTKSNEEMWLETNTTLLREENEITGLLGVVRDITARKKAELALKKANELLEERVEKRTCELHEANEHLRTEIKERKQAEEALRQSEEKYRLLVENMNDGLIAHDEHGVFTYANDKFLEITGYSREQVIGRSVLDFLDQENRNILEKQRIQRTKGRSKPYEISWTSKGGGKIPTLVSPTSIFDRTGRPRGSFAVVTDITELKKAEKALRERESDLENKRRNLEEVNTALRVLLEKRDEDKIEIEEKVLFNTKELVLPYLEKLKATGLDQRQTAYAEILESNLKDVISSFAHRLSSKYLALTPAEIQIANLVKQGRSTKDISELFNVSRRTIESHRDSIRNKLGLKKTKANLRTHLMSLQ